MLCPRKEKINWILCVLQPLDMRQEAACLHRKDKARRHNLGPISKGIFFWKTVERIINFNCVKFPRVPCQHLRGRKTWRVKDSAPYGFIPLWGIHAGHPRSNPDPPRLPIPGLVNWRQTTSEYRALLPQ